MPRAESGGRYTQTKLGVPAGEAGGHGEGYRVAGKGTLSLLQTELSELLKCEYVSMLFGDF